MKVLLTHRPGGAYGHISESWLNTLQAAGHTVQRWDGQRSSWDSFGPDLYIGCSGHRQPIPADRGHTKIAIHVNPYCDTSIDGINEPQDAVKWTVAQNPTVVFGYGHESDRPYWSHWTTKHQIPWVPMPTAGDSTMYSVLTSHQNRDISIGYVGGYWPYKARNIDRYVVPLLNATDMRVDVRGWGAWPSLPGYRGNIEDGEVCAFLNRVKVGPCVTEPHTTTWGIDLPERLWKVALCGALVVHDNVKGLERFMPSVVMAHDPGEYHNLCRHYSMCSNEERNDLAKRQRDEVLRNHTYFKRMATLFMAIHEAMGSTGNFGNDSLKLAAY